MDDDELEPQSSLLRELVALDAEGHKAAVASLQDDTVPKNNPTPEPPGVF